jgi:hypothetical protein
MSAGPSNTSFASGVVETKPEQQRAPTHLRLVQAAAPQVQYDRLSQSANTSTSILTTSVFIDQDTFYRPTVSQDSNKMSDPTREEIQAQIAASEARGEIKMVRLEGKIENLGTLLVGKIDSLKDDVHKTDSYNRDTRLIVVATIVAATIAIGGIVVAMATYGDALFGRGMNVRDVIQTTVKDTLEQAKKDAAPKSP